MARITPSISPNQDAQGAHLPEWSMEGALRGERARIGSGPLWRGIFEQLIQAHEKRVAPMWATGVLFANAMAGCPPELALLSESSRQRLAEAYLFAWRESIQAVGLDQALLAKTYSWICMDGSGARRALIALPRARSRAWMPQELRERIKALEEQRALERGVCQRAKGADAERAHRL